MTRGPRTHAVRLVTWLPGILLAGQPLTGELCRNLGTYAAKLGCALSGFEHPASNPDLIWNMNHALSVRDIAHHVPDVSLRAQVTECIDYFATHVAPAFHSLRTQVVHNDLNPENVLLDPNDTSRVAGVIDFGDMASSPLVVDVAVTASYMREFEGNPLAKIAEFVRAYQSITPLERREIDLVFDLVRVRLATTVAVLCWRIAKRGADDPYLNNSVSAESTAGKFLKILGAVPREHARQALRQACASTDVARAHERLAR
jgi:Ser/Thr protein kinase RdoA (MazF antagonist)